MLLVYFPGVETVVNHSHPSPEYIVKQCAIISHPWRTSTLSSTEVDSLVM